MPLRFPDDLLNTAYCSKTCQTKASTESQNLLFGLDSPLPHLPAMPPISDVAKHGRREAQQRLVASLSSGKVTPLLVARFIGRQVAAETIKLGTGSVGNTSITASGGAANEEYSLYDHIERLRYLDLSTQHEEVQLVSQVLETAMPGLEQFVNDERYTTLKGKMAYNVIGVCFGGGRSDKVSCEVI
jgi:mitochondrial import receptor subunit TOM20